MPETTVVIRAYNEARHLPALLQRLRQQRYRDFEVVVVDSGSVDGTPAIVRHYGARLVRVNRADFTFGYSLNVGIRAGTGPYVAVVSAHTLPVDEGWLGGLVESLGDPQVAMVCGRQLGAAGSKFSETQDFRRVYGSRRRVLRPPDFFANNANSAVRRDLWEQYPFDEGLPGLEDIDWAKQWMERGYLVVYEPAAALHHIHEETWPQVRHRYYREGVAARKLGVKRRRHIPAEFAREAGYLMADIGRAVHLVTRGELGQGFGRCAREIIAFRKEKLVGTITGLLDGALLANQTSHARLMFESSFAAVVIEGPRLARLTQVEMPELHPGSVVIRVGFVGVCATDLEIFDGTLGYFHDGPGAYPIVPGHEVSGTVVAMGPAVQGLAEGDHVVSECILGCGSCDACDAGHPVECRDRSELGVLRTNGGYARYMVVPGRHVHKVPPGLDLVRAVLCEPLAVALKGVGKLTATWRLGDQSRECGVVGGGPLGRLCALLLARQGHRVTVFDSDQRRLEGLRELALTGSQSLTDLARFDAIVEVTGDPLALDRVIGESRTGASILMLGFPYGRRPFNFEAMVAHDKTAIGSVGSGPADFRAALALLPELPIASYVGHVLHLSQYAAAWHLVRHHGAFKVILRVD